MNFDDNDMFVLAELEWLTDQGRQAFHRTAALAKVFIDSTGRAPSADLGAKVLVKFASDLGAPRSDMEKLYQAGLVDVAVFTYWQEMLDD